MDASKNGRMEKEPSLAIVPARSGTGVTLNETDMPTRLPSQGISLRQLSRKITMKTMPSTLHSGPLGVEFITRSCNEEVMAIMQADDANIVCADCPSELGSDAWASTTQGIFLCIKCCGVHRSLGTHISQCRSVDLDNWATDHVSSMCGNRASNAVFEAHVPLGRSRSRPLESDPLAYRADWIKSKYVEKAFVKPTDSLERVSDFDFPASEIFHWRGTRKKATEAFLSCGVLFVADRGSKQPSAMVALDPSVSILSSAKSNARANHPQDRPVDSSFVEIFSEDGSSLCKLEAKTASSAAKWLKALRSSSAYANRTGSKCGSIRTVSGWCLKAVPQWYVIHGAGLYYFAEGTVLMGSGQSLPEASTLGKDWRGVLFKSDVHALEYVGAHEKAIDRILLHTHRNGVHVLDFSACGEERSDIARSWLDCLAAWADVFPNQQNSDSVKIAETVSPERTETES